MLPMNDPTAIADQEAAAARTLHTALTTAAATGQLRLSYSEPPPWLAMRMAQLRDANAAGAARGCPHLAAGPRIIVHTLWHPLLIACTHCAHHLTPDDTADVTCDRCGKPTPVIHGRALTTGPLMIVYGLCEPCRQDDEPQTRPAHQASHRRAHRPRNHRRGTRR